MKKTIYILLLSVVISCDQNEDLPTRYVDDVFSEVAVSKDILYGNNTAFNGFSNVDLFLDVYHPLNDVETNRPTIVLAHGGAFVSGQKEDLEEVCMAYAKKGYVAVSASYRLMNIASILNGAISDSVQFSEGVVMAIADIRAAIRYIRNDALNQNTFGVDPERVFVGGISAGAIIANHIGFMNISDRIPDYLQNHLDNNGGFEGNSNDLAESSQINGVLSFSGSLSRINWMTADDPPIFMVHEEFDEIVPCDYSASDIFPFEVLAYGACDIQPQAGEVGIDHQFIFIEGSNEHVGYAGDEVLFEDLINQSALFLSRHL